jgi:hypothetical protein
VTSFLSFVHQLFTLLTHNRVQKIYALTDGASSTDGVADSEPEEQYTEANPGIGCHIQSFSATDPEWVSAAFFDLSNTFSF